MDCLHFPAKIRGHALASLCTSPCGLLLASVVARVLLVWECIEFIYPLPYGANVFGACRFGYPSCLPEPINSKYRGVTIEMGGSVGGATAQKERVVQYKYVLETGTQEGLA